MAGKRERTDLRNPLVIRGHEQRARGALGKRGRRALTGRRGEPLVEPGDRNGPLLALERLGPGIEAAERRPESLRRQERTLEERAVRDEAKRACRHRGAGEQCLAEQLTLLWRNAEEAGGQPCGGERLAARVQPAPGGGV